MLKHRLVAAFSAVAVLLALAGVSGGQQAVAQAQPAADPGPKTLKVVLLGDSYSAGNGSRYDNGDKAYFGPSPCHRSHANWASRYVAWLTEQGYHVTFINRACSDGVAKHLVEPRDMDDQKTYLVDYTGSDDEILARVKTEDACNDDAYPDEQYWEYSLAGKDIYTNNTYVNCKRFLKPQTDAIGPDTDLVLFTMGGNDIKFSSIVTECFAAGPRDPGDCRDAVGYGRDHFAGAMEGVQTAIDKMRSNGLREDARIVYLGYPLLAQDNGYDLESWFGLGGDHYEVADEVRALGLEGNTQQAQLVANDNASHPGQVRFISTVPSYFEGHEPDGSATGRNPDRWINEFFEPDKTDKREWYHPNNLGHEAYKDLLVGASPLTEGGTTAAAGDIDIVFTIDTTGSMGGYIAQVKQYAEDLVDQVQAQTNSARFALVSYRDDPAWTGYYGGDYPARVEHGFTTDAASLKTAVDGLSVGGGGDWPETMYSGIDAALDLPWRPGVKKVVIVLADAPPHDPEPISGLTGQDVIDHALAVDPAEVYVVDTGSAVDSSLSNVIAGTGGSSVDASTSDVPAALLELLQTAIDKPYAWINGPYTRQVGKPVTIDGSGSYATSGDVVSYDWDYDADGTIDQTTATAVVTHTWTAPYSGIMSLTVTDSEGRSAVATTHVGITDDGDEVPRPEDNCPNVENQGQDDEDADGVGDACDDTPGFPTEDQEGVFEGSGSAWVFGGFRSPVADPPAVNRVKGGSSVPVKFVLEDRGLDIFVQGSPSYVETSCATGQPLPTAPPTAVDLAGSSALTYSAGNSQYEFVWKTARTMSDHCYRLDLGLRDGSSHSALFQVT